MSVQKLNESIYPQLVLVKFKKKYEFRYRIKTSSSLYHYFSLEKENLLSCKLNRNKTFKI